MWGSAGRKDWFYWLVVVKKLLQFPISTNHFIGIMQSGANVLIDELINLGYCHTVISEWTNYYRRLIQQIEAMGKKIQSSDGGAAGRIKNGFVRRLRKYYNLVTYKDTAFNVMIRLGIMFTFEGFSIFLALRRPKFVSVAAFTESCENNWNA